MIFWIISTGLSAVVAAFFLAVMRAQSAQPETTAPALLIYKQQLHEVEKDVAKGLLAAEEAERLKIEISRRILALDATSPGQTRRDTPASLAMTAGLITVTLLGGTFLMYREYGAPGYENLSQKQRIANAQRSLETRPSLEEFAAAIPVQPEVVAPSADYTDLVEKLRKTVTERPDDLEGHVLLANVEAGLQNFAAAAQAQEAVLKLKGEAAEISDFFDHAELLILSVQGYVAPEAEAILRDILKQEPTHEGATYYIGLMMAQNDRPDQAFRLWRALLEKGPADAPWITPIRDQIEEVAVYAGINDYVLPDADQVAASAQLAGPTQSDIDAASDLSADERMIMIEGMVAQLAERLGAEGGSSAEWARLIGALSVLGRVDEAQEIWREAQLVFAGSATDLETLQRTAEQVGLIQ